MGRIYVTKSRRFHTRVKLIGGPFDKSFMWLATNCHNTIIFKVGENIGRYLERQGQPCFLEWQSLRSK